MNLTLLEWAAALCFAAALLHTLCAPALLRLATRLPQPSRVLHCLCEVELIFALWAVVLCLFVAATLGPSHAWAYVASRQYTEPMFVFVVMLMAASKPMVTAVMQGVQWTAARLPLSPNTSRAWLGLGAVPLLGSLITEPAAMTLAALLLSPLLFRTSLPARAKYLALGVLFVNVSIGGTLTSFAAPPVLMVAHTWGWDSAFMLQHFGWKAALAVLVNASVTVFLLRHSLQQAPTAKRSVQKIPLGVTGMHLGCLGAVVVFNHQPAVFLAVFLVFLLLVKRTPQHQSPLLVKEALWVSLFLTGLVLLGGLQQAWLQPLLLQLDATALFVGAAALTAITDNAALTYLGAQVPTLSDAAKYNLVAGAVAGGGLTVIANAPNPAGAAILKHGFDHATIRVPALLLGALAPTAVAMAALFWL